MQPKVYKNRQSHKTEPFGRDYCQTPPYAILPLLSHLPSSSILWEPAQGKGYLVQALRDKGYKVIATGYTVEFEPMQQSFFTYQPPYFDIIVTNPPWSIAEQWLKRCYELSKPFALLLKTEIQSNKGIQRLCQQYGPLEFIYPDTRIDYEMPKKGWEAHGAPFNSHWYTYGLNIGQPFTYLSPISKEKKAFKEMLKRKGMKRGL